MDGDDGKVVKGMPECPICLEKFNTMNVVPRILPVCGHCLCEKCISHMLGVKQKKAKLVCPNCRVEMGKEYAKLAKFPKNWTLLETLKVVTEAEEREKAEIFDPSAFGIDTLGSSESFDGSSLSRSSSNIWICTKCTLHNSLSDSVCEACEAPRPKRQRRTTNVSSTALSSLAAAAVTLSDDEEAPEPSTGDPDSFLARLDRTYNATDAKAKKKK
eukprot:TRINITY_DN15385_c0_g1_i1.p1 TRINITY_DN15385_c0_g1~~TRINITY_DN15385_c0_g1_i1.p1  ORF type:complete len:226 (+),score=59.86 TRINITY_DN15385_c0_g1_i1:36-680(+)